MEISNIINVKNLSLSFETNSSNPVFSDLSFSVKKGEHIALTGSSGCGKSSVLGCLLGFVEPTSGEITISGKVLNPKSIWSIREKLALVPQEADLGTGTAGDFIERPFKYRINSDKTGNLKKIPEYMDAVGLSINLMKSNIGALSGGEKQRIALVSALLLDRPIMLLDEVASALDRKSEERVFDLLSNLTDKTIIGVVHDKIKMPFADREININTGV